MAAINESLNQKMTALADEIRELSGSTEPLGIDAMTSTLNTENANFNSNLTTQDDLISQIQIALEGKASGGSGDSGGGNLNTCTIHVSAESTIFGGGYIAVTQLIDGNIVPSVYTWFVGTPLTIENVICGSVITGHNMSDVGLTTTVSDNITFYEVDGYILHEAKQFLAVIAPTEPDAVGEISLA